MKNSRTTRLCLHINIQTYHTIKLNIFMFSGCFVCVLHHHNLKQVLQE